MEFKVKTFSQEVVPHAPSSGFIYVDKESESTYYNDFEYYMRRGKFMYFRCGDKKVRIELSEAPKSQKDMPFKYGSKHLIQITPNNLPMDAKDF